MPAQAPQGGMTSPINGQWYEGGEFMPEHGLFCGKAGARRQKIWEQYAARNRAKDCGGSTMYYVGIYERGGWTYLAVAIAESKPAAVAAWPNLSRFGKLVAFSI